MSTGLGLMLLRPTSLAFLQSHLGPLSQGLHRSTEFIAPEESTSWPLKLVWHDVTDMAWGLIKEAIKRLIRFGPEVILPALDMAVISSVLIGKQCWPAVVLCSFVCGGSFMFACAVEHDCLFLWLYPFQTLAIGHKRVKPVTYYFVILSHCGKTGLCLFKGCK